MNKSFDNNKREYIIKNMYPRRPLINYLWNEELITKINHFGIGPSTVVINGNLRQVVADYRLVYIKDIDNNQTYAMNRNFDNLDFEKFTTHVGLGYTRIVSQYKNIAAEMIISVPEHGFAELIQIKIKNISENANRKISVYPYIRPFVNTTWFIGYNQAEWDHELNGLVFEHNGFKLDSEYQTVYMKSDLIPIAYETTEDKFIGTYGSVILPEGIKAKKLTSSNTVSEENFAGVFQYDFDLKPNEEVVINLEIGLVRKRCEAYETQYLIENYFVDNLEKLKITHEENISKMVIDTPDEYLNTMVNIWLKRQVNLGKTWARVYGKGFRDVLQDCTTFVSIDSKAAKAKIIYALKHQFISGNTIRMYEPIYDHPYQDGAAWIPGAILEYLKETNDFSILNEMVPYYDAPEVGTVREHMLKGVYYLFNQLGKHGLVLWAGGDWNDAINNAGIKGIGESVWLSIATVKAAKELIEILEKENGDRLTILDIQQRMSKMSKNIMKHGWDGEYFIYGFDDYGNKIGSQDSPDSKILLNAQTWAVLAGIMDEQELNKLMDVVEKYLKCDFGYVQNYPSMDKKDSRVGRMSYFQKGVFENGSVYIHGVTFKIVADCILGRGDEAYESIKMISFDNPKNPNSGVEPYAISNMYYGPECERKKGFAPQSWITGSAGWLYKGITQYMIGVKPHFNGLLIKPSLPKKWSKVKITRQYKGVQYDILLIRAPENKLIVNGQTMKGNFVPEQKSGIVSVVCYFK